MQVGTNTASLGRCILTTLLLAGVARGVTPTTQPAQPEATKHEVGKYEAIKHATKTPTTAPAATSQPTPNYSGDLLTRSTLTGDWGGLRNELAEKGITLDVGLTQIFQGLVGGGKKPGADYGGRLEATLNLDFQKLGLWEGAFVQVELEGKYGNFSNNRSGALTPVDINGLFPVPASDDWALPAITFAQFVSPQLGFIIGKMDTTGGDMNEFAHGKGEDKFLNMAFNFNPILGLTPCSTLGVAAIFMPDKDILFTFAVLGPAGEANRCNFDNVFKEGVFLCPELRLTTHFFDLTGHQLIGGGYSTKRYVSLEQTGVLRGQGVSGAEGTWDIYYNFDQYIYQPIKDVDRGLGVFGRFGASDGQANPTHFFYSAGIGAKGLFDCRPLDKFGLGYYYSVASNANIPSILGFGDGQGMETYYQIAVTPWMSLTPDFQVIQPSQERTRIGYFLGLRMHIDF